MTTETAEETITCKICSEETPEDDSRLLEDVGDVCQECHADNVKTCQLCGDDEVPEKKVSDFILCKSELSLTATRPPGIFRVLHYPFMTCSMLGGGWMYNYDVLFIDKLPKAEEGFEISGNICAECAKPYVEKFGAAYGKRSLKKFAFNKRGWELEKKHTRLTILENQDMLRDLECDRTSRRWEELQSLYELPDLPTYNEWVFVEHKGVKVYFAGYKSPDSWMTWHPEPRFRSNGYGKDVFAPSGLPNWKKHHGAYERAGAERIRETFKGIDKPPRSLAEYKRYLSPYDTARAINEAVTIEAIELGIIRQDGVFDRRGRPLICR